jgi:hypothetical protein
VRETDAGEKTADFAFSSAMDLQVKLSNDGYAQRSDLPMSERWPQWANWRNTAYALTFEPAVFVYHKPSFKDEKPPASRAEFVAYLKRQGEKVYGRVGTYDIERSGVGFLFMARDQEQFRRHLDGDPGDGRGRGETLFDEVRPSLSASPTGVSCSATISSALTLTDWASRHPDVGIVHAEGLYRRHVAHRPRAAGGGIARTRPCVTSPSSCRQGGPDDHGARICTSPPSARRSRAENTARTMSAHARRAVETRAGEPGPDGLSRPGEARANADCALE